MVAVYKRELKSYFVNMTAPIAIGLILLMTGIFVKRICLVAGYPTFEQVLPYTALILMVAIPILAMRTFAEEKRQKTDLLLYSLPISTAEIVMGKYFAMLTVTALPVGVMALYPLLLSRYGTVDFLNAYGALLAFFLLAAAMGAICMFMSSLTESQVIAAVLGIGALVLCYVSPLLSGAVPGTAVGSFIAFALLGAALSACVYAFVRNGTFAVIFFAILETPLIVLYLKDKESMAGKFQDGVEWISLFERMNNFVLYEVFDLTAIVYYLSVTVLFVFLTVQVVEKRRWA